MGAKNDTSDRSQNPSAVALLLTGALLWSATSPAHGGEDESVHRELKQLRGEVAGMRQSLARLEEKLAESRDAEVGVSPLVVRVRDSDGKPLEGYKIYLVSQGEGRTVKASGTSGPDGVAIRRRLPYGDYRYSATNGRWSVNGRRYHVEFGVASGLEIVAPAEGKTAALRIRSGLDFDSFAGMRFGEYHHGSGMGSGQFYVPEPNLTPQETAAVWSAYPMIDNGVEEVAATIRLRVTRSVEQPSGRRLAWDYTRAASGQRYVFTSSGEVIPCKKVKNYRVTAASRDAKFFAQRAPKYQGTGYYRFVEADPRRAEARLVVPAGDVALTVEKFYGRASGEVLASLEIREEPPAGAWLAATLQPESAWVSRTMGSTPWEVGSDRHPEGYAVQSFGLTGGEERVVVVGPAANQWVQETVE